MQVPAYAIGLPSEWVEEIRTRAEVRHIAESPTVPNAYVKGGIAHVESPTILGRYLQPKIILWYGYFPEAHDTRLALALGKTPTFPDIRQTVLFDDKMQALLLASNHDALYVDQPDRGVYQKGQDMHLPPGSVLKWGNSHCGEGKQLVESESLIPAPNEGLTLVEPFLKGESYRALFVDNYVSVLHYESSDWRKNVGAKVTKVAYQQSDLAIMAVRGNRILMNSHLLIAGIDFIFEEGDKDPTLLELNAYPSLDEDDEAREAFIQMAANAVKGAQEEPE